MPSKDALELIDKVNALYSGGMSQLTALYTASMSQLIAITVSILAIVGVIIPALVAWLQSRQFNKEQKLLKSEIHTQVHIAILEMQTKFAEEFEKKSLEIQTALDHAEAKFEKELNRIETNSNAKSLHLQAQQYWSGKRYGDALYAAASAMTDYAKCKNEANLLRVWAIAEAAFPLINKNSFREELELEDRINEAVIAITSINSNGRYSDLISDMKKNLNEAKER